MNATVGTLGYVCDAVVSPSPHGVLYSPEHRMKTDKTFDSAGATRLAVRFNAILCRQEAEVLFLVVIL